MKGPYYILAKTDTNCETIKRKFFSEGQNSIPAEVGMGPNISI